jgi:phosphohistidine phosphatase
VAAFLARGSVQVGRIFHSGKKRAWETAELFRVCLIGGQNFDERDGIAPLDPVVGVAEEIQNLSMDTMFVGHLPFMGKLVAHLIAGNEDIGVVSFTPGTVVCLERDGNDIWSVAWMVRPELLKSLS